MKAAPGPCHKVTNAKLVDKVVRTFTQHEEDTTLCQITNLTKVKQLTDTLRLKTFVGFSLRNAHYCERAGNLG